MRKISAQYIFTSAGKPLKRGIVTVASDGTITSVEDTGGKLPEKRATEFYNGIIIPGLVNCHAHLELSHLRRGFDEVAEGWGEYEVVDPEGGRRILVPWDPASRDAYLKAERARSESLGFPRKGFRYFRLSAGDDRAPVYWKVLEYLYG